MEIKQILKENPRTASSIYLSIATIIIMLLHIPLFWLITLVVASRKIWEARKAKEYKKFIIVGYIALYIPVLLWILNAVFFAFKQLEIAKGL